MENRGQGRLYGYGLAGPHIPNGIRRAGAGVQRSNYAAFVFVSVLILTLMVVGAVAFVGHGTGIQSHQFTTTIAEHGYAAQVQLVNSSTIVVAGHSTMLFFSVNSQASGALTIVVTSPNQDVLAPPLTEKSTSLPSGVTVAYPQGTTFPETTEGPNHVTFPVVVFVSATEAGNESLWLQVLQPDTVGPGYAVTTFPFVIQVVA